MSAKIFPSTSAPGAIFQPRQGKTDDASRTFVHFMIQRIMGLDVCIRDVKLLFAQQLDVRLGRERVRNQMRGGLRGRKELSTLYKELHQLERRNVVSDGGNLEYHVIDCLDIVLAV